MRKEGATPLVHLHRPSRRFSSTVVRPVMILRQDHKQAAWAWQLCQHGSIIVQVMSLF